VALSVLSLLGVNGEITPVENGRLFLTPLCVRVAYLEGETQPLLGPDADEAELFRTHPSKLPFIL